MEPGRLIAELGTDGTAGLTASAVQQRLAQHGPNELASAPPVPLWRRVAAQFSDLVIWILIAAAVISGLLREWPDTLAILAIVLVNGVLGFLQEERAQRSLAALAELSSPMARVVRDGQVAIVPARDLVPGDLLMLEAGDRVPADARLLSSYSLQAQEAALTGESVPTEKDASAVLPAATPLADRRNTVYLGTIIAAGKGAALTTATAMETELGRIAGLVSQAEPEPTPLERRLTELGKILIVVCLGLVAVIFALQMLRGGDLVEVFLISVSLAVAAVPEGLPAVVTISLALGLQRMVKRNALVRKLPSVETLGSVTVICTDKTGTLTRNEMTVRELRAGRSRYRVTGVGYAPRGQILRRGAGPAAAPGSAGVDAASGEESVDVAGEPDLRQALVIAARANNARVSPQPKENDSWQVIGDPTEGALIVAALKGGIDVDARGEPIIAELPFDSDRKAMSVVVRTAGGQTRMYTKGAPEVILRRCVAESIDGRAEPLSNERRRELADEAAGMAARALRVLALAYRGQPREQDGEYLEEELVFAGLAGMIDPPREEARAAVLRCRLAGIRAVMITGDHPETAAAIAGELRMDADAGAVVTGRELDAMSDEELAARVNHVSVYARVTAEHKMKVVRALKRRGQVVAMTGDGVNDAPAVRAADIGIAMGVTGTDVTKEASDMVLTDDNFVSIVGAVEEGRGIFDNIQKFVHYLLSCNTSEVLLMFVAALVGWPSPLVAIQILWINLVTDGLPALALAMEPPERDIMDRPPRPPREPVITLARGLRMLVHGALLAAATLVGFGLVYRGAETNLAAARTTAFCIAAFGQLCYSFACRSQRYTLPELGIGTNPYLFGAIAVSTLLQLSVVTLPFAHDIFETGVSLGTLWLLIAGLSLAPVTIIEVTKLVRSALRRRPAP
ncbi:MAG: cation-translocating P-type ATPase [Planctomycetia bacterium]|nr:cation-translocating P-type ATPase [Planctomycetia bacterium]